MNSFLLILLIILILLFTSKFAKVFFKKEIYLGVLILLKTNKFIKFLDKIAKNKKILYVFSDIGLVIGFGAFGLDYVSKNKLKKVWKRVLLFLISSIVFIIISYFSTKGLFLNNPLISKGFIYFLIILTGVMGLSGFTLGSLIFSAYDIIIKLFLGTVANACPGIGLVIPGVKMPKVDIFIPWYGWIILIFSAVIHEFSHGAILRSLKLKIKSIGVILAGILPLGAFVEPDEKQLKKIKDRDLLRMYSAGPMSNVILAIIFFLLFLAFAPTMTNLSNSIAIEKDDLVYVYSVEKETSICGTSYNSPAYGVFDVNDVIISVNDINIRNRNDLLNATKLDYDNKYIIMSKDTNILETIYLRPNEMGRVGFSVGVVSDPNYIIPKKYYIFKTIYNVLLWSALLNFIIATVNYLPTHPFDGGGMSKVIFSEYLSKKRKIEKRKKIIGTFFGIILILLLILNILPYFF
ncbi:MAG: site-2 protease family protein [Candidatus ainarchaeum sp.]|nr:site-2 protease family protein [Candidatus ainarchaeum sp.]MDD3976038.1 site-2 protease family protein [Candidatus ainarchaeum sp.]